jgi:hypothetical protein
VTGRPDAAEHTTVEPHPPSAAPQISRSTSLLDQVELAVDATSVLLSSGRRVDLEAGPDVDRLVVRTRDGQIVLRIAVGDDGPVLSFSSATLDLEATKSLRLAAQDIHVEARGDLRETVGGTHHTRVAGEERLEAARVELQANKASVAVRARERITLDAEHIGLNDEPLPAPFVWSLAHEHDDDVDAAPGSPGAERDP